MLLQTNSNSVIDHMSSDVSSAMSDSSFEDHVTPQPHPSISSMVCSDSSGCGCSNALDIQSFDDSIAQHSCDDCRKGEGLKTAARLPHFSQLSTPLVGESASIVVTNSNLNSTNETTVTESNGQHEIYQRMLVSVDFPVLIMIPGLIMLLIMIPVLIMLLIMISVLIMLLIIFSVLIMLLIMISVLIMMLLS